MIAALVVAVLAAAASVLVAVSGDDGPAAKPTTTPTTAAAGRGARLDDPDVVTAFLAGASSDIVAVTTYDYRRLDDALSAGLAVTTGSYRTAFQRALTGQLAATAKADHLVHDFQVRDLGIGAISGGGREAKVLIFGRQLVSDRSTPKGAASLVTLCATIRHSGARYLISELVQDGDAGAPPGSPELAAAIEAGRSAVVNALTYTRAQFDADLRRALAGAVDPLRRQLQQDAPTTRAAMTKGKYDLTGVVTSAAVKSATPHTVVLLVAAESSRISAGGSQVAQARYEVTVTDASGSWAASQINTLTAQ